MALNIKALQQLIAAQQSQEDGLVSFKAGRMDFDPASKMVTAQKAIGKVKIVRDDSGVSHFTWLNRMSGETALDVMLLPHSATWAHVEECKDGRVFVLKMAEGGRKHFFWMQEPSEEKDSEFAEKVSKLCRGESLSGDVLTATGGTGAALGGAGGDAFQRQMQQALAESARAARGGTRGAGAGTDFSQMLLAAMRGGGVMPGAAAAGSGAAAAPVTGDDALARALMSALSGGMGAGPTPEQLAEIRAQLKREPDLTEILNPAENAEISVLLEDDEKAAEQLQQHLPEEMRSPEDIVEQMQTPQFRTALLRLQTVLNSPNIEVIMMQMGLERTDKMGVKAFIDAVIQKFGTSPSSAAAEAPAAAVASAVEEAPAAPSAEADADGDADMADKSG